MLDTVANIYNSDFIESGIEQSYIGILASNCHSEFIGINVECYCCNIFLLFPECELLRDEQAFRNSGTGPYSNIELFGNFKRKVLFHFETRLQDIFLCLIASFLLQTFLNR